MKSFERREKVARALKMEIGNLIQRGGVKDDRLSKFISIVDVSLNQSLSSAKVYFSILSQSDEEMTALEMSSTKAALNDNAGTMRGIVARKLNLRYAPKIYFVESESLSKAVDMVELIDRTVNLDEEQKGI